jgi:PAS domain S-box-containing protein
MKAALRGGEETDRTVALAVERERNLYKDLVASQPSGVYRLRIKAQKAWGADEWVGKVESHYALEMVSDLFCEILGATREQCEANAAIVVDRIHPEDRPGFVARNVRSLETLEPFAWEGRLQAGGKVTWVHFASVARRLDDGDVLWTGILLDITERTWAEQALRRSEEAQRTLIAALPDVIMRFDADCRHLFASENVKDFTGLQAADFMGKTHQELGFPAPLCEFWEHAIRQPFLTGTTFETEFDIEGPSGRITFNWRLTPDLDEAGRVRSVLAIARDVTERKRLEQERRDLDARLHQAQRLESLGVLAGGIAHDFNNILMAVLGHADLALDELSPLAPGRESIRQIKAAAMSAAELCAQMLAYSGKGRLERQDFCLSHLVDEMVHMLKTGISRKCVLNLNLEKQLPRVRGDVPQLRQVLMNLVINASEAIGDRSGSITVSTGAMECPADYLTQNYVAQPLDAGLYVFLEVSDTGCGMSRETVDRMFEPFFTTKFTGRGLGLAAVLGIVQAHGGAIRVYSEAGRGTTVKVLFPAVVGAVAGEPEAPVSSQWRGRGTVLLADDEETVRAVSRRLLERLGLDVLTAEDGQAAVAIYGERQADIDMVLLDLTMPRMNGEEAFRELRRLNPGVRVILASGYSEKDIAGRFAGKGLAGCLQKPYTLDKLRSLLSSLLPET